MGEIGSGAGSSYPATLDTDSTKESVLDDARTDVPNDLADCLIKIETALGSLPAGNYADVKTRLNNTNTGETLVVAASGYISAQNANYVCDGISDEDTILTAINALPAAGGKIALREGIYLFLAELVKDSFDNVEIEGCGKATKIQRGFASASAKGLFDITNCNNWRFRNFWIDGQSATYASTNNRGINIGVGCADFVVDTVVFEDISGEAIYVKPHATTSTQVRGIITDSYFDTVRDGIHIEKAKDITIIGNKVITPTQYGIYSDDGHNNVISHNIVRVTSGTPNGIHLTSTSRTIIGFNEVLDDASGAIGIRIGSSCDSNIIIGNFIRDFNTANINFSGTGGDENFVIGNFLLNGVGILITNTNNRPYCIANHLQNASITDSNKAGYFNHYRGNLAPSTITVGASPYSYQNVSSGYPVSVLVSSGTVSAIEFSRDGSTWYTTGLTAGMFSLNTYDSLRTTFSVAPSMIAIAR